MEVRGKMARLNRIIGTAIALNVGRKVIKEISWENRKVILKGKSLPYKFLFYISHYL